MEKKCNTYLFFWKMKDNGMQVPTLGMTEGYTLIYANDSADAFLIMDKQFNPTTIQFDIRLATILPQ